MGKHRKDNTGPSLIRIGREPETISNSSDKLDDQEEAPTGLAALVRGGVPVDETGEPTDPSNPDLWGNDPFYDRDERPRFAAWAFALVSAMTIASVGGVSFMYGKGQFDEAPMSAQDHVVTETATVTGGSKLIPGPTISVTVKSQSKPVPTITATVTRDSLPAPTIIRTSLPRLLPGPTIFRTREALEVPAIIKTISSTVTVTQEPEIECYRVKQGSIVAQIDCP